MPPKRPKAPATQRAAAPDSTSKNTRSRGRPRKGDDPPARDPSPTPTSIASGGILNALTVEQAMRILASTPPASTLAIPHAAPSRPPSSQISRLPADNITAIIVFYPYKAPPKGKRRMNESTKAQPIISNIRDASRHDVEFKASVFKMIEPHMVQKGLTYEEVPFRWSYKVGALTAKHENFINLNMGEDSDWEIVWDEAAKHARASVQVRVDEQVSDKQDDEEDEDEDEDDGPPAKKGRKSIREAAEELANDASRVVAELLEKYKCMRHPMRVCYLNRGQHQTLSPIQQKLWADLIIQSRDDEEPAVTSEALPQGAAFDYHPLGTPIRDRSNPPSTSATSQEKFPAAYGQSPHIPWPLPYAPWPFLPSPTPPQAVAGSSASKQPVSMPMVDTTDASDVEGPELSLALFVSTYKLGQLVAEALKREDASSPADINHLNYDAYIRDVSNKGLGLKIGSAQRLRRAMTAWRKGVDFEGNPLEYS